MAVQRKQTPQWDQQRRRRRRRRRRRQQQEVIHEHQNRILLDCCTAQGRCRHLQLEHECGLEDLSHVGKGDARLLGVQVLGEEVQAQLEEPPPAKGCLLAGHRHMLLYPQALQHLQQCMVVMGHRSYVNAHTSMSSWCEGHGVMIHKLP